MSDFKFDLTVEAFEKSQSSGDRERRIGGFVSTEDLDRQQEIVLQKGLEFGPFLKSGWFNDNHDQATAAIVGYPEIAEIRNRPSGKQGWYVEGYLLKSSTRASDIWAIAQDLKKSGRKLGFSVEGAILDRDPVNQSMVRKAIVQNVAITGCPVNSHTELEVLTKSLSTGAYPPPTNTPVTGEGGASVLASQSLESDVKNLTKEQAIKFLMKTDSRLTYEAAKELVDYAMRRKTTSKGD